METELGGRGGFSFSRRSYPDTPIFEEVSQLAKDLTVTLEDRPGTLAAMGEALGKAGINIEGACGFPVGGKGIAHLVVEDAAGARRALEQAGIQVSGERDVLVINVEDKPGALGSISRKVADAGVNIEVFYLASRTRLVLGTSDNAKAKSAVGA